jgi:hypothetical protein
LGLFPIGLSYLRGAPGVGKTAFAMQAAIAAGLGGEFLGRRIPRTRVLYLALDESARSLSTRMKLQATGLDMDSATGDLSDWATTWPLLSNNGLLDLHTELALHQYQLVVVDTFSRLLAYGEHRQPALLGHYLAEFARLATDHNAAILLIDHHPKPLCTPHDPDPVDALVSKTVRARGDHIVFSLHRRLNETAATLRRAGDPTAPSAVDLVWDPASLRWYLRRPAPSRAALLTSRERETLAAIAALDGPTLAQLVAHLHQDKSNLYRRLQSLTTRGLLTTIPGPKGSRYQVVPSCPPPEGGSVPAPQASRL